MQQQPRDPNEVHPVTPIDRLYSDFSEPYPTKTLFHLEHARVSKGSHETCYAVFFKEVSSSEELVRSADKGELMGKYRTRDSARDRIDDLARPYGEFAIFE